MKFLIVIFLIFCCKHVLSHTQVFARSMGCMLLEPLLTEMVKTEKSPDHCQAALTQLTRVGVRFLCSFV